MRSTAIILSLLGLACGDPAWPEGAALELRGQTSSSVGVIWEDATSVSEYQVYLDDVLVQTQPAGITEATIEELAESTTYLVEVAAVNLWGTKTERLGLQVGTSDETAPVFPDGAQIEVNVGYNIMLSWPEATDAHGPLSYIVRSRTEEELVPRRSELWSTHGDLLRNRVEVLAVDSSNNESIPLVIEWTEEELDAMNARRRALEAEYIRSLGLDIAAIMAGDVPEDADPLVLRRLVSRHEAATRAASMR